jgi:hypothetical protein
VAPSLGFRAAAAGTARFQTAATLTDSAWRLLCGTMDVIVNDGVPWDEDDLALLRVTLAQIRGTAVSACDLERAVDRLAED